MSCLVVWAGFRNVQIQKDIAACELQISLLSFRTQFIVAGPGLVPWQYDTAFIAGMSDYLGIDSGVGNLTIRNWAEVNLANFPVSPTCSP